MNKEICTLSDLFVAITLLVENYEKNLNIKTISTQNEQLYGINDIIKMYPKLSKYLITKAIDEGKLPTTKVGKERCFYVSDIEKLLQSNTTHNNSQNWRTDVQ